MTNTSILPQSQQERALNDGLGQDRIDIRETS